MFYYQLLEKLSKNNFRKLKTNSWNNVYKRYISLTESFYETIKHFKCISN